MPEGVEAEIYRRAAAGAIGRTIRSVGVDDRQPEAVALQQSLPGLTIAGARRHGKLVLIDLHDHDIDLDLGVSSDRGAPSPPSVLGLHFGMTGRLVVDDVAPISRLEYGSGRDDPAWDRLVLRFGDAGDPAPGALRVNDPRRWARFSLDPDTSQLGPDALGVDAAQLGAGLNRRRAAVKAVLLDQSAIAGLGNLCVDEVLWVAGVSPHRPAGDLTQAEVRDLAAVTRRRLAAMLRRGGSHCGTISPALRAALPPCPRDGEPMRRDVVGGRTTVWCPAHQR